MPAKYTIRVCGHTKMKINKIIQTKKTNNNNNNKTRGRTIIYNWVTNLIFRDTDGLEKVPNVLRKNAWIFLKIANVVHDTK